MKGRVYVLILVMFGLLFLTSNNSFAAMPDANNVKEVHEGADVGCTVCHPAGDFKALNAYGKAYNDAGRSVEAVKAVDGEDSDADGVNNAEEIIAGTNPGE